MRKLLVALPALAVLFTACSINNVTEDSSLGRFFDSAGVRGCFAFYDNGQGHFTIYNLPRYRDSAYSAGATFDILSSLVAFQSGVVKDDKAIVLTGDSAIDDPAHPGGRTTVKVDYSITRAFQSDAMENDVVFRRLADSIGPDSLKKWVDSLHYGDQKLGTPPNGNAIKIPADEQLGLIKKLYFNQLPFYRPIQEMVRAMMTTESNSNYKLVYKTSRVLYKDHVLGWVMGWVEENKHPYFFVLNVESPDTHADITGIGNQIVKRILSSMGFFQGKK
jgi:beta-lactamase class D